MSLDSDPLPRDIGCGCLDLGELAPVGLCLLDRSLRIISLNRRLAEINERPREEHPGRTITEVFPHDLEAQLEPACRRVLDAAVPSDSLEYRVRAGCGEIRHWRVSIRPARPGHQPPAALHLSVEDITTRKNRELEEQDQLKFERLIADLSNRFVNLCPEEVDDQISRSLKDLVEFLDVDRASAGWLNEDGRVLRATHSYAKEGFPPYPLTTDVHEHLPYYATFWTDCRVFRMCRIDDLPVEAAADRAYVEEAGVKSALTVPVRITDSLIGGIAVDSFTTERRWPDQLVQRIRLLTELLLKAQLHQQAQQELSELRKRLESENIYLRKEINLQLHHEIIGDSRPIRAVLEQVEQVAPTDSTVLITGETGTGKELVAREIHRLGTRRDRALIRVNCASLAPTLMESELFGRKKGAYTGADTSQAGRFELAHGSTIFLDEVGELPLELQVKLLRVLNDGEFERLGRTRTRIVDVRVLAATNRDLERSVREGRFREDLYYRLNVFPVRVPPLRERREDIPLLVRSFVAEFNRKMGKHVETVSRTAMEHLRAGGWPGNVRELRNVIERAMIVTNGDELQLPPNRYPPSAALARGESTLLADVERRHILEVLIAAGWRVSGAGGAAERLGLKPTTLEARMRKLGIKRP